MNWTFSTILPVEISFIDRINAKTGLSFSIRPSGNRFQFDNQSNFATASSTVYLQLREFHLGTSLFYKFAKDFTISGEAGLLLGGKMNFRMGEEMSFTVSYLRLPLATLY